MKREISGEALLSVQSLCVSYKQTPVVQDVSLNIHPQQIAAIVGPNGAGKTTLLKAISGLIRPNSGRISFKGVRVESLSIREIVERGIVYVPEGMSVFPDMTVMENLEVGAYLNRLIMSERLDMVFSLFPELYEKRETGAGILSGGQKRMVTLGRGLMSGASLLLLDDPFLGLSPKIVKRFCDAFRTLRQSGITLFTAGQHVRRILNVADTAFLIEDGNITLTGHGVEVLHSNHLQQILFGSDTTSLASL
jgi:branched-chain amino acid transport system ATP-binding protein